MVGTVGTYLKKTNFFEITGVKLNCETKGLKNSKVSKKARLPKKGQKKRGTNCAGKCIFPHLAHWVPLPAPGPPSTKITLGLAIIRFLQT